MLENQENPEQAQVKVAKPRRLPTLVWIIPLLAVGLSLFLGVKALLERGPEITLQFSKAEGLEANKTRLKYKDVNIGTVRQVVLSEDRSAVLVKIQVHSNAKNLLSEDSRFWVVRPRVTVGGISGLATLLSGVYIAVDPGRSDEESREFVGLEEPPAITSDTRGRQFRLSSDTLGSLDIGSPVFFRRIQVGRVIGYSMMKDGKGVDIKIFVDAPYDRFVTSDSRFWHASGIDVGMGSEGIKVSMQSVVSLVMGGIAFSSPEEASETPQPPAQAASNFTLHPDQAAAQRQPDSNYQKYLLVFHESVRGLLPGAPLDFRGITVGEVSSIRMEYDKAHHEHPMIVEALLYPGRFSRQKGEAATSPPSEQQTRAMLNDMVARGFRAQLRTNSLISGQRYVALDYFPKAQAAQMVWAKPAPYLPTQPGSLDSLQDQLMTIASTLQTTLQHADKLISHLDQEIAPEFSTTLKDARKTLEQANKVLAADSPMQQEMRDTLREVGRAASSVRNLADLLERQPEALLKGKKED
ncbi:paraquat-inducible protein [Azospira sp. I13]|uniref:PqiB family protein n=1 Tax=Azospira sp. I13 TaxID=1765050 RepID=UPI000D449F80|nr:MlaD family protein [Azospira sp. I13]GBG03508.1 paraquat-inducible protein [Azospira sp. I13]